MEEIYSFSYGGQLINYTVIRTKRRKKTIEIKVTSGQVVVRSPYGVSYKEIDRFVEEKADWIICKIEQFNETLYRQKQFIDEEEFYFMGDRLRLKIVQDADAVFTQEGLLCVPTGSSDQIRELIRHWYFKQAQIIINSRIDYFKSQMGVEVNRVRIKEQKTRWGSCSSLKNININWRIIQAPLDIIDLVIVHELVHLKVPNHSAEFYRELVKILPDHRQRQLWLKENKSKLI